VRNRRLVLTVAAALILGAGWGIPRPAGAGGPERVVSVERARRDLPLLALTFDGGGDAGDTARVLATLREKGVTATFFLTGEFIRRNPELVRQIVREGHEVGNHTWSHPHLTTWARTRRQDTIPGADRTMLARELSSTARAFEEVAGRAMSPLWRAPYGEVNDELLGWAAAEGWTHVGWTRDERGRRTLDSLDWVADRSSRLYLSSERIVGRLLAFGEGADGLNGGIVLMHLCTRREDPGVGRLDALVDTLRGRGYGLLPVGELLRAGTASPGATFRTAALRAR
jgi:peptidoglycan/xylan/chitin deacetylase (PgdA/CDA1 family)